MLSLINSCSVFGMNGYPLTVEVDVSSGIVRFDIVGLPDATVKESRERVRAALRNSGFEFPLRRITVNLAPADIRKEGALLDLPIAIGILAATGQIDCMATLTKSAFVGELSLDGVVRPVIGALPMADCLTKKHSVENFFVPVDNAAEAAIIGEINIFGVSSLRQLVDNMQSEQDLQPIVVDIEQVFADGSRIYELDMRDVKGQQGVKRALEIAAAGAHNVLMLGSPGSGKTMLAKRLPGILPELSLQESIEVTKLYSISGLLPKDQPLITARPFRSPHHGASSASIIGGGAVPRPGEISLASHGVLFMDELPEFSRDVLEALRQPLEDNQVTVARVNARVDYPANFQFVAAMNPCPCGYFGDSLRECTCTPYARHRYLHRISGPLLDRIDLHIEVPRVNYQEISGAAGVEESSAVIRKRVIAARKIQERRFSGSKNLTNASMSRRDLEKYCICDEAAEELLREAFRRLRMSGRAHDRILKVARTIADLDGADLISAVHIGEAIQYRSLDREE